MQRGSSWIGFVMAGTLAIAVYIVPGLPGPADSMLYNAVALAAGGALVVGARRRPPEERRPWYLFAAGQACWVGADISRSLYEFLLDGATPFPSAADLLYLGGYPFLSAGLVSLARRRSGGGDRGAVVDAAILASAFGMVVWSFLMEPHVDDPSLSLLGKLVSLAYPLADVVFLGVVVRLLVSGGTRSRSFVLLGAATLCLLVAHVWYGLANAIGTHEAGGILDGLWLASYVLWGAAALVPQGDDGKRSIAKKRAGLTTRRLVVLYLVVLLGPVVLVLAGIAVDATYVSEIVIGCTVMSTLVIFRLAGLAREVEQHVEELREKEVVLRWTLDERNMLSEQLQHQVYHDPLTGLANRTLFLDRCEQELASEDGRRTAVVFVDVDDFKAVNDGLGHAAGDLLLRTLSDRMRAVLREGDLAARFGGDEFVILLPRLGGVEQAAAVANRLKQALSLPHELEKQTLAIYVSLGVALSDGSVTSDELLRRADSAMYAAKQTGKNRLEVFDPGRHGPLIGRGELKTSLMRALADGEFRLEYQPVVELVTGRVEGAEALIRWNHPERGLVPPLDFIPLAEETDLIVPIGLWVLREALVKAAGWRLLNPHFTVSVNVSARQLADGALPRDVAAALKEHDLPPHALILEVTERDLADGAECLEALRALRALGVRIAIDDFGTGYSSLAYLSRLPLDVLKIDRSFTRSIDAGPEERAFTAAVVKLGRTLSLDIVGEGIETPTARTELRVLGCRWGQGYYFAPPLPPDEFTALLERRRAGVLDWGSRALSS